MNLLGMLQDQVSGPLAKQASSFLGESETGITKTLGGAFPAILGSMIDKGSSKEGAGSLMESIGSLDGGMLDNMGDIFKGGSDSVQNLLGSGGGILESLLGNKLEGVIDVLSKVGGLKKGSVGSIIKMAAPFLMSMVGKQIMGKGPGALMDLLKGQKEHVSAAMPSGMGQLLGMGGLLGGAKGTVANVSDAGVGAAETASNAAKNTVLASKDVAAGAINTSKKAGGSILKWIIPAILVLALLGYLLRTQACSGGTGVNMIDNAADKVAGATDAVVDGAKDVAGGAADMAKDGASAVGGALTAAFNTVDEAGRKALDGIKFAAGSAGESIMTFIKGGAKDGNGVFRFNNLNFNTGSAAISGETGVEVDNLAAILKAYPGVKAQIQGHTDNTGDAAKNKTLSQARADAVVVRLTTRGIDASRLSAVGFGQEKPVNSNDTEEGRLGNRRVEVRISN